MANSTTLYLTGILEWAHHLFVPDEYEGVHKWKVNFYPDEASMKKLKDAGSKKRFKQGTYGQYTSLSRDTVRDFKKGKGPEELTPPDVRDADGNKWEDGRSIGNGTKATVKLILYPAGRFGIGTRLEAVRVDELVEYVRPDNPQGDHEILPF